MTSSARMTASTSMGAVCASIRYPHTVNERASPPYLAVTKTPADRYEENPDRASNRFWGRLR